MNSLQLFRLQRDADASGVSGTGTVAVGIVFPDGQTVLKWLRTVGSLGLYASLEDCLSVHGHDGATRCDVLETRSLEEIVFGKM